MLKIITLIAIIMIGALAVITPWVMALVIITFLLYFPVSHHFKILKSEKSKLILPSVLISIFGYINIFLFIVGGISSGPLFNDISFSHRELYGTMVFVSIGVLFLFYLYVNSASTRKQNKESEVYK